MIDLFKLSILKNSRNLNKKMNAITFLVIAFCLFLLIFLNRFRLEQLHLYLHELNSSVSFDVVSVLIVSYFGIAEIVPKILFKSSEVYFPTFIEILPIPKLKKCSYDVLKNVFDIWNWYSFLFFIPFLFHYCTPRIALLCCVIAFLLSYFNSMILKIFKRSNVLGRVLIYLAYFIYIPIILFLSGVLCRSVVLLYFYMAILLFFCILSQVIFWRTNKYCEKGIRIERQSVISYSDLGMEFVKMWRAKQLRTNFFMALVISVFCSFNVGRIHNEISEYASNFNLFFFSIMILGIIPLVMMNKFLGMEANYFCGLYSKPFDMKRLFETKWRYCLVLSSLSVFFLIPAVVEGRVPWWLVFSLFIYENGVVVLFTYIAMFFVNRINYNSVGVAMNYEGMTLGLFISILFSQFVPFGIILLLIKLLSAKHAAIVLLVMGILGISFRKYYFDFLYNIFWKKRYDMMERFRL